ncbi:MAG: hypothetical protein U9N46_08100 [Euryarchaeota archaeon]|nr:MAG: hypothetical protein C5S47_03870 [ANME-2 cluster archaeon]MEA1865140.1 hypothetical protein [Euryarchaeota archaeon]
MLNNTKNTKNTRQMRTILAISLLLACAFMPCIAVAENETDEVNESGEVRSNSPPASVTSPVQMPGTIRGKYQNGKDQHIDSRQDLLNARDRFRNAKTPENRQELRIAAQNHLVQTVDRMIARLELLRERIEIAEQHGTVSEGASVAIDTHIRTLEGLKSDATSAESGVDIAMVAQSIRDEWRTIRVDIPRYTAQIILARTGQFVVKAENLSDRINGTIEDLAEQSVDTADLSRQLDDFDSRIDCVKENCDLAEDALDRGDSAEVRRHVHDANACIRDANHVLKAIFRELRGNLAGSVALNETGSQEGADE